MADPAEATWRPVASIRARLAMAFCALIALLVVMAGAGAWWLGELNQATHEMADVNLRLERLVGEWLAQTRSNAVRAVVLTHSDDPALRRILAPALEDTSGRITGLQKQIEPLLDGARAKELFRVVGVQRQAYLDARKAVLDKKKAGDSAEALRLLETSMLPAVDTYVASIRAMADHFAGEVARDAAQAEAKATSGRNFMLALGVLGAALAVWFSWLLTRAITGPLEQAVVAARRVAEGDLTVRVVASSQDEMGELLEALEDMSEGLRRLVADVATGAQGVADTSAQIAQGNIDLSQRTEEQASTLEQTASSMEEMTSTVAQNADHARQASQLANNASGVASQGGRAVGQVVATMQGIAESSRRIGDIIGVIDGIAFQTNILALNAAVEAARAGDQGRGFAVVAAEVRQLAQRSAAAAKEIKQLIADSVERVDAGARQVEAAGSTMNDIVRAVKEVSDLIAEIAAASREQSDGINQVNTAVTQMEQGVQQNASLVEQATAATESMKGQADALLQAVSRFNVGGFARTAAAPPPARRPPAAPPERAQPPRVRHSQPRVGHRPGAGGEWKEF